MGLKEEGDEVESPHKVASCVLYVDSSGAPAKAQAVAQSKLNGGLTSEAGTTFHRFTDCLQHF